MERERILLDSVSYFRLAQNVHPLLFEAFGDQNHTLFAHDELEKEFSRNPRLEQKFDWFEQPEYKENRKRKLKRSNKEQKEIDQTYEYMWEYVKETEIAPSETDTMIVAIGATLEVKVVTDDTDMISLAKDYGVHYLTTLELLKLMLSEGHITMEKVKQVVEQWVYDKDLPKDFKRDFKKNFGVNPPTY